MHMAELKHKLSFIGTTFVVPIHRNSCSKHQSACLGLCS